MTRLATLLMLCAPLLALADDAARRAEDERNKATNQRLAERKISFSSSETPFDDVMQFVGQVTGISILVARGVETPKSVTANVRGQLISDALKDILGAKLTTRVRHGILLVGEKARLDAFEKRLDSRPAALIAKEGQPANAAAVAAWKKLARPVVLDFSGTP